jgi:uncharacterized phiE125 gp8 family phage protein
MKTYGILKLTATSPAQVPTEPITLAEAKQFVKFIEASPADPAEEYLLEVIISAAREIAETIQGRDLVEKQYDLVLDTFVEPELRLRDHLQSVDLVSYKDSDGLTTTMVEDTDFIKDVDRGLILPPYDETWPEFTPWPSSAVLVRFTVSPPAVPSHVVAGIKLLVAHLYENRTPVNIGNIVNELPFAVKTLLEMGARNSVL